MPALANREEEEAALLLLLMRPFDDARRDAQAGRQVDWQQFEDEVQAALESQLAAVFVLAAIGMGSAHGHSGAFNGDAWAGNYSRTVAGEVARNSSERLAAGSDPAAVFGRPRAETIAITEVTTAVTRGEAEVAADIENTRGEVLEPFWQTAHDAAVCPVCAPFHNTPRDVWGDDFPAGPPAHPRCRCNLKYKPLAQGLNG